MDEISIIGIGVISNLGNDVETIWEKLMQEGETLNSGDEILFESGLSLSQRKKANRYSEIGFYVSKMALKDSKINVDNIDKKRVGTVYTTGYGPIVSSLKFSESVVEGDYEFCSPTIFANTVNNTCVGHICMLLGFKGVSTVLMGSNNLTYSQILMNKEHTDYILTGAIEEYCKELHDTFQVHENSKNIFIKEGAVSLLVKNKDDSGLAYCNIVDGFECNIDKYPITDRVEGNKVRGKIKQLISEAVKQYDIDVFFSSCNNSYFDCVELEAAQEVLNKDTLYVNHVKNLFGETLGAAFNMNVMVAALCIKNSRLPLRLDSLQRKVNCALVSGYDISGNYMLAVLKSA
ncbi:3-oxoacyl-ACP synthase [Bacillus cereus]|uniref:beta-ketoacyl synthase N-terminal-like domain-containing protein n=1 Tax=Bacillus cereus TaxID=1396 RepID=UPI000BF2599E|nr:beta-ketoacyl synthase N-terminal-like domain-containing protein [Bacillus cereus]PER14124.1 3-oxoacyl-ACP synthase [Bacillus cereus]PGL12214.1 3-oxoacyl-ACP synthase [Bacillus cereus]